MPHNGSDGGRVTRQRVPTSAPAAPLLTAVGVLLLALLSPVSASKATYIATQSTAKEQLDTAFDRSEREANEVPTDVALAFVQPILIRGGGCPGAAWAARSTAGVPEPIPAHGRQRREVRRELASGSRRIRALSACRSTALLLLLLLDRYAAARSHSTLLCCWHAAAAAALLLW